MQCVDKDTVLAEHRHRRPVRTKRTRHSDAENRYPHVTRRLFGRYDLCSGANRLYVTDETGGTETVIDARTHMRVTTIPWGGDAGNTQYDPVSPHNFVDVQTCSPQSADPRMNPAALRLTCGCAISRSRFCRSREALRSVARLTRKPTITPSRQRARRSLRPSPTFGLSIH